MDILTLFEKYAISIMIALLSIIVSIIILKKYLKKFSWLNIMLFSVFLGGAWAFIIPILGPFFATYYLRPEFANDIYMGLLRVDFLAALLSKINSTDFHKYLIIFLDVLFVFYDFGFYIIASHLYKEKGSTICFYWYYFNVLVLMLMPLITLIAIVLSPVSITCGIVIGTYTGIKNYLQSVKNSYMLK